LNHYASGQPITCGKCSTKLSKDIVIVERDFYGAWSPETRDLLADGAAVLAFKQKALALYKQRFAPLALLRKVDAWNERGAPDGWQDKST